MTESEALELIAAFAANGQTVFAVYITFTSGYLVLCYVVGSKLTQVQAIGSSVLYVFAALSTIFSIVGQQQAIAAIQKNTPTVLDGIAAWNIGAWNILMPSIMIAGILMSLYFMYYTRRQADT